MKNYKGLNPEEIIKMPNIGKEIVREKNGPRKSQVISSTIEDVTMDEIIKQLRLYENGKCECCLFQDEAGWMYDVRHCIICGGGLGLI